MKAIIFITQIIVGMTAAAAIHRRVDVDSDEAVVYPASVDQSWVDARNSIAFLMMFTKNELSISQMSTPTKPLSIRQVLISPGLMQMVVSMLYHLRGIVS
ncbi:hypothetical protein F4809DRAFT_634634 [Biscogniauxia mediterranea]|nr:hypothetical protein F4809DRAFT_634634 [Biscogniauxia mediterranea]